MLLVPFACPVSHMHTMVLRWGSEDCVAFRASTGQVQDTMRQNDMAICPQPSGCAHPSHFSHWNDGSSTVSCRAACGLLQGTTGCTPSSLDSALPDLA